MKLTPAIGHHFVVLARVRRLSSICQGTRALAPRVKRKIDYRHHRQHGYRRMRPCTVHCVGITAALSHRAGAFLATIAKPGAIG